uniref:TrmO family methyltransferase domain-containing protein n=1 Tax=Prevotella sp. TaxID=59823 RepID=UPI004024CFDF
KMGGCAPPSPFRPTALGLSSVRSSRIETATTRGPVITVVGADLMDGTPIYDIKPYIPYADSHPEAKGGFTDTHAICRLTVVIPDYFHHLFSQSQLQALYKVLELDPRPHYHKSGQKEYGMPYMDYDVHFTVNDGVLTVTDVVK